MEIKKIILESIEIKKRLLTDSFEKRIVDIIDVLTDSFQNNQKLLIAGNGGSNSDANHIAGEFVGKFYFHRSPLNAIALNTNNSILTAIANDYSYEDAFARELEALAIRGDIFWGISTSGNSKNIVKAMELAKEIGVKTIGFTGERESKMDLLSDYLIKVPSSDTPRVQEIHILIAHIICQGVEADIFGENA